MSILFLLHMCGQHYIIEGCGSVVRLSRLFTGSRVCPPPPLRLMLLLLLLLNALLMRVTHPRTRPVVTRRTTCCLTSLAAVSMSVVLSPVSIQTQSLALASSQSWLPLLQIKSNQIDRFAMAPHYQSSGSSC